MPQIGMNLDGTGLGYYGKQFAFLDRFMTAGTHVWSVTTYSGQATPIRINATTQMPGGQSSDVAFVNTSFNIDPVSGATPDRYVITWSGTGSVEIGFNAATNVVRTAHSYTFDYTADTQQAQIIIRGLTDSDPIHDLHIVRADQLALFQAGQVFNPAFIDKVSQWGTLRFMDWGNTNASPVVNFADMPGDKPSYGDGKGVSLKIMVELANAAGTDMWYCVPAHANDDFVRQALTYIRDHLNPALKLHLEYSNEVWNGGFEQAQYVRDMGAGMAAAGVDLTGFNGTPGGMAYYGYRSAQIAHITDQIFGSQSHARVENVIATQTYWTGLENEIFQGIQLARVGTARDLFEEYAITTYFGDQLSGGGSAADRATVLGWARGGANGMTAAFNEMLNGGTLQSNLSLVALRRELAYHAAVANNYGLSLVAYEGGAHLNAMGYQGQDQRDIADFIKRLVDDPRMGQLYTQMVNEFVAVGGQTLVAFTDVGEATQYGAWGILNSIYDSHSPRYDALVAAQQRAKERR